MSDQFGFLRPSDHDSRGSQSQTPFLQQHGTDNSESTREQRSRRRRPYYHDALNALDSYNRRMNGLIPRSPIRAMERPPNESSRPTPRRSENPFLLNRMPHSAAALEDLPSRPSATQPRRPRYIGQIPREFEGLETLQQVEDHLRQVHTSINDLFYDETPNHIRTPTLPAHQHQPDDDLDRPRTKRIKLDSDDKREGAGGFRYGHYGQVVQGALEMDILSCDGGSYEPHGTSSWPSNVLLNDNSVYCTKSDRCNIILKHKGEMPFSLKKLVIKAPKSGFDSPYSVREGMIFVAMDADNLLSRTAQYQIVYSPHSRNYRYSRQNRNSRYLDIARPSRLSLEDSIDQTVWGALDPWANNPNGELNTPPIPARTQDTTHGTGASDLRITTDHNEVSDDEDFGGNEEDPFNSVPGNDRDYNDNRDPGLNIQETDTDPSEISDNEFETVIRPVLVRLEQEERTRASGLTQAPLSTPPRYSSPPRRRRRAPGHLGSMDRPFQNQDMATAEESSSSVHPEVMKPHARFSIEREKSMINIKFDPPASGRFILIKLWSPSGEGNIDIQSIIAKGFSGPRFFPSIEVR